MHFPTIAALIILQTGCASSSLKAPFVPLPDVELYLDSGGILDEYPPPVFATRLPAEGLTMNKDDGTLITAMNVGGKVVFFRQGTRTVDKTLSQEDLALLRRRVWILLDLREKAFTRRPVT